LAPQGQQNGFQLIGGTGSQTGQKRVVTHLLMILNATMLPPGVLFDKQWTVEERDDEIQIRILSVYDTLCVM